MSYDFEHLRTSVAAEGIATVTIHRPQALNALNDATIRELDECFLRLSADDAVKVVIVTGAGERAFVAGADIRELAEQGAHEARARARAGQRAFDRIERAGKPVLAAINGFALGGGLELALACHLRYAAATARLGLPEVTLGIIPGYGGTQRLQRIIGRGRALEWILSGEMLGAEEGQRIGLLNGVFPASDLIAKATEIAHKLASRGPIALRFALDAVLRGGDGTLADGLALEADLFGLVSATADMKEGMRAFLDKRPPQFRGA